LYVIYRALPGGSDLIILYYCLMATWTSLGDNTELFWAVLSQQGLHSEEFTEQCPMGLDPQESFAEMHEDGGVEDTVEVEVEVFDAVVPPAAP
jgi:hypothetical protein